MEIFVVQFSLLDPMVIGVGLAALGLWVLVALGYGLYANDEIQAVRSTADDFPGVFLLVTLLAWVGLLSSTAPASRTRACCAAGVFWASAVAFLLVGRGRPARMRPLALHAPRAHGDRRRRPRRRRDRREARPAPRVRPRRHRLPRRRPAASAPRTARRTSAARAASSRSLRAYKVERVIFAFSRLAVRREQIDLFRRCMELGVQVDIVPRLYEVIGSRMQVHDVDGLPLVGLRAPRLSRSSKMMKRSLDLAVGGRRADRASPVLRLRGTAHQARARRARCSSARSAWAPAAAVHGS